MTWLLALACTDKPAGDSGSTIDSEYTECIVGQDDDDMDCDGWSVADGDCDDTDSYAYPGADDVPYDGIDNDCAGDGDLVDMDGDGYDSDRVEGGTDCNDGNPTIYPGAPEVCYDDIDQDCAGDEDSDDCDGDGFDGAGDNATDCNDDDPEIYPGQDETWYDGIDQDCSGYLDSDYDQDGDGEDSDQHEQSDGTIGTDCDDEDELTGQGLPELWDGVDRDCDGTVDNFSWANAWSAWSPKSGEGDGFIGLGGALLGDLGGDGYADIAMCGVGSDPFNGTCFIVSAEQTGIPSAMYHARIDGSSEYFGSDAANIGDITGDGIDELLVGGILSHSNGSGMIFDGADLVAGGDLGSGDAMTYFTGNTYLGTDVAYVADVDGDGLNEVAGGVGYLGTGHTIIYSGAEASGGGVMTSIEAMVQFDTPSGGDVNGSTVGGMDFDGDGLGDMMIGAYVSGTGAVIPVTADDILAGGAQSIADMTWIRGETSTDQVGMVNGWMDDLDGDGYDELLIHAYGHLGAAGYSGGGRIFLLDGDEVPTDGERYTAADLADTYIDGTLDYGHVHTAEESSDVDNNGVQDLIAVESGDRNWVNLLLLEGEGPVTAQAGVIYGEDLIAGGALLADMNTDEAIFLGREGDDLTGFTTLAGDLDFDGLGDFVFGSPAGSANAGQVYSVLNRTGE
ncbi:MAG: hypothetical protein GY913_06955 [Proteobacteria bacterium]|nr:hypothetical protein [Pseudomonadota bacterium]